MRSVVVVGVYAGETIPLQLGVYWARALTIRFTGLCSVHAWWERAMDEVYARTLRSKKSNRNPERKPGPK